MTAWKHCFNSSCTGSTIPISITKKDGGFCRKIRRTRNNIQDFPNWKNEKFSMILTFTRRITND